MKQLITIALAACAAWSVQPASAADVMTVPLPPTEVKVTFPGGGLYGYMEFDVPQLTVGGEAISGVLTYKITVDNQTYAEGEAYPGVSKSVDINMDASGVYEFAVSLANEIGESEAVKYTAGAGYSPAEAPQPKASLKPDGNILVSWPAVTRTVAGGSLSGENVTYRVERYPDGYVLAESTPELSVTDSNLDGSLQAYRYYVMAIWNATPSEENYTNAVVVGKTDAPFSTDFSTRADMDLFTVFNEDGDSGYWDYYAGEVTVNMDYYTDSDDWLISPAIGLSNSGIHPVSIDLKVFDKDFPATVEVCYGYEPTPEAMTMTAIPAVSFDHPAYQTYTGTATSDGRPVYFGIHNITKAGGWKVFATNFKVDASAESLVPAAATDFTATPDYNGALKVALAFNAPTIDLSGEQLTEITRAELLRDGELIHTFTDIKPGQKVEFTDEEGLTEGQHAYTLVCYNDYGTGLEAKANVYAGINLPATPASARAYETDVNGIVTIEWEPVSTTIDGAPLNPELVTYSIWTNVTGQDMKLLTGLTGTSHTFRVIVEEEPQLFFQFGVTAETAAGENGMGVMTEYVPLGEPHPAPFEDSFPDVQCNYTYVMGGSDHTAFCDNASDNFFEEVKSQDKDNGMLYMYGEGLGSSAYLMTGKIDLRNVPSPMFTFYAFNLVGDLADSNTIEVFAEGGSGEFESLGVWTMSDFGTEDWHRIAVPLDKYKDGSVRLRLVGTINSYQYIHIDNMQVRSRRNYDLAITSLTAPERIKSGNECPIIISYANFGLNDAPEFNIEVLQDGNRVANENIRNFPTDGRGELTIPVLHSVTTPENVKYDVRINYAPDQNAADNTFPTFEVITISPSYPVVSDLTAGYSDNPKEITLNWSAPDMSGALEDDMVEDFEASESWKSNVEGWKFVDVDRQYIYGFEPWIELPEGAPKAMSRQSWWVCDGAYGPMVSHFSDPQFHRAHSGDKYLISMAVTDEEYGSERSDDWAISPELPGTAQTLSFWAKSMLEDAPETFEVLYSSTDTELESFQSIKTVKNVGWDWTNYFFDLPEGAKYFAIRSISRDAYVLMIDDVNYIPAGTGADLKIAGYNVYRQNKRLNEAPLTEAGGYVDMLDDSAVNPVYNVTTLYTGRGESKFSNDAIPAFSAVEGILDQIRVSAAHGQLNVEGADGMQVNVYSADGMLLHSFEGENHSAVRLQSGIYLVSIADRSWKVVVR